MTRQDLRLHSVAYGDACDSQIPIDALIWSGLRRVFPLPPEGHDDKAFQVLLTALTRRHGSATGQGAVAFAGAGS